MTVKELRDVLATLPDDMLVMHEYDGMWSSVDTVRPLRVSYNDHFHIWEREREEAKGEAAVLINSGGGACYEVDGLQSVVKHDA